MRTNLILFTGSSYLATEDLERDCFKNSFVCWRNQKFSTVVWSLIVNFGSVEIKSVITIDEKIETETHWK